MADDPTLPIVEGYGKVWSQWLFMGSLWHASDRGALDSAIRGRGATGEWPSWSDNRPGVYEIRILPQYVEDHRVVYVGRTTRPSQGISVRLHNHFFKRDCIYHEIRDSLDSNCELESRYIQFERPEPACALERDLWDRLKALGRYPWNKRRPSLC